ncbi:MAG: fibronectin type III domain-containing protein [Chitinivibrionales bacterium]
MTRRQVIFSWLIVAAISYALNAQTCNTIDAVTTASFKITGGQACATTASLNWSFTENNGTLTIRWGTTTSYGNSGNVYSAKPYVIKNLTPNTTYYYAVDAVWQGSSNYHYTRSSFKTASGTMTNQPPVITGANNRQFQFTFGNVPVAVPCKAGQSISISIFSLSGARVFDRSITPGTGDKSGTISFKNAQPGVYLVKVRSSSYLLTQKIFLNSF